jgi:hypothetical protein
MDIFVGDLVVGKGGGGFVLVVKEQSLDGKLFCVSIDKAKTIKSWFDPADLKKAQRRPVRVTFN